MCVCVNFSLLLPMFYAYTLICFNRNNQYTNREIGDKIKNL